MAWRIVEAHKRPVINAHVMTPASRSLHVALIEIISDMPWSKVPGGGWGGGVQFVSYASADRLVSSKMNLPISVLHKWLSSRIVVHPSCRPLCAHLRTNLLSLENRTRNLCSSCLAVVLQSCQLAAGKHVFRQISICLQVSKVVCAVSNRAFCTCIFSHKIFIMTFKLFQRSSLYCLCEGEKINEERKGRDIKGNQHTSPG